MGPEETASCTQPASVRTNICSDVASVDAVILAEALWRSVHSLQGEVKALRKENVLLKESLTGTGSLCGRSSCLSESAEAAQRSTVAPAHTSLTDGKASGNGADNVDETQLGLNGMLLRSAARTPLSSEVRGHCRVRQSSVSAVLSRSQARRRQRTALLQKIDVSMAIVIVANIFVAGIETAGVWETGFQYLDLFFTLAYLAELLVKLKLYGVKDFFIDGTNVAWNIFDAMLVLSAVISCFIGEFSSPGSMILRVCRLSKLVRLVRLVRVPELDYVEVILCRLSAGMKSMKGSIVLLSVSVWCTAVLATQFIGEDHASDDQRFPGFNKERDILFSDVFRSFLSVFRCINGDCSMSNGSSMIIWFSQAYGVFFAMPYFACIIIYSYGMLNLIMALFVESTLRESADEMVQSVAISSTLAETRQMTPEDAAPFLPELPPPILL